MITPERHKLSHPLFIGSLLVLLVNDHVLKAALHNTLTGKLSDVAGLFAFPFFLAALYPKGARAIHTATVLLFTVWKSAAVEPLIVFLNANHVPVQRTVDYTDLLALPAVMASYIVFTQRARPVVLRPVVFRLLLVISFFAFTATSLPPATKRAYTAINKTYRFPISKTCLIAQLNNLQLKELRRWRHYAYVEFNAEQNTFHAGSRGDTIAYLLDNARPMADTIDYKTSLGHMLITGDETSSSIVLLEAYRLQPIVSKKDYGEQTVRLFERHVVKKIRIKP